MTNAKPLAFCTFHSAYDNTSNQHGQMLHRIDQETCAAGQRRPIRVEQLPMIAAPKNASRRLHGSEVIYNNVQPANVCQGCFVGNKFCDFQARGPRARVRKCVGCADSHCACVMTSREGTVRDPNGNLSICQTFKCYFRQYRHALHLVKHPSSFRGIEHGQEKVREAQRIVRKFRPVDLHTLRKYVLVCPRRLVDGSIDLSITDKSHRLIIASASASDVNTDRPCSAAEGRSHSADDNDLARIHRKILSRRQSANEKSSAARRPPPYLLLSNP